MAKDPKNTPDSPERRDILKSAGLGAGVLGAGALGAIANPMHETSLVKTAAAAETQVAMKGETPIGEKWWPSEFGADDEAGASNRITAAKVMEAVQLIQDGTVHRVGRVYEAGMPLFGARAFTLRIPGGPTGGTFGQNKIIWNDEFLATEIGQVGTQFDGLGHIGVEAGEPGDQNEMRFYNGFTAKEANGAYGLNKIGMEKVKPFFTRGILIDVEAVNGGMMDKGQEITVEMMAKALDMQGLSTDDITEGDAVFFHTGWGSLWMENNDRFNSGCPGIGMPATKFLAAKKISMVGADTWPVEVVPNPDANLAFPCHQELLVRNGIFIHENLDFTTVKAAGKSLFAYIFAPLPIKGATGSPGAPIAVT